MVAGDFRDSNHVTDSPAQSELISLNVIFSWPNAQYTFTYTIVDHITNEKIIIMQLKINEEQPNLHPESLICHVTE